jgi:hypothetical protein
VNLYCRRVRLSLYVGPLKMEAHCRLRGRHHVGGENQKRLLLLIPGLSLRYLLRLSVFPQVQTDVHFIEERFHWIQLKYIMLVCK